MKYKKPLLIGGAVLLLLILIYFATRKKPTASNTPTPDQKKPVSETQTAFYNTDPLDLKNPNATVNGFTRKQYAEQGVSQRDIDILFS